MRNKLKKAITVVMAVAVICNTLMSSVVVEAANGQTAGIPTMEELRNTKPGEYVSTIATPLNNADVNPNYDRSYDNYEVKSEEGFLHPGIIMNREELNIMRDMVWIGAEPWASVFEELKKSPYVALDYNPGGPFEEIASDRENYALTRTSTAVYEMALMWYITGKQEYAARSIELMMGWAETVKKDSKQDHLRIGTSTHKLCIAAEIFRYTPSSGWNEENTEKFSAYLDLINPAIDKAFQYYNQGGYALMAYTAKNVFQNNWENYKDAVERFAYNKNFGWKGGNSVNYSLSAMVFNSGQFVEMGRDQEHAWDDIGFMAMVAKTTYLQGTKVNDKGEIVTVGGEDLYEYGNQKVLKAAAFWQQYCIGEEVPFVPNQNAWGQKTEWATPSNLYRGQTIMWLPSLYYHYRYTKGYEPEDARTILAPTSTDPSVDYWETYEELYKYVAIGEDYSVPTYVREENVDFPDFQDLTFTPLAAIKETGLAGGAATDKTDQCKNYGRFLADKFSGTGNGERDSSQGISDRRNGGVITEPGVDEEGCAHFVTSDIQNGEWVAYNIDFEKDFGENVDTLIYTFGTRSGVAPKIDVYISEWVDKPAQSDYEAAVANGKIGTVELGTTNDYTDFRSFAGTMDDASSLTGKKTVYFYYYGSNNSFAFHGNCIWFKFVDSSAIAANTGASADSCTNASTDGDNLVLSNGGCAVWENMDFDCGAAKLNLDIKTAGTGTLKVYVDGKNEEEGGKLVTTCILSETDGEIQFNQAIEKVIGRHSLYLVYEGSELTIRTFSFEKAQNNAAAAEAKKANDYTALVRGTVEECDANSIQMNADNNPYVTYLGVAFPESVQTLAVKVKSTGRNRLEFDLVTTEPLVKGEAGRGGNLAYFDLPDTTALSDDGYVTLYFDLEKTGMNTLSGSNLLGMGVTGDGNVAVDSFWLNPENTAPKAVLTDKETTEVMEPEVYFTAGSKKEYTVSVADVDEEDAPQISVYGALPQGFTCENQTLTISEAILPGNYTVQFLMNDGEVHNVETFVFHVQSSVEEIEKLIKDSGIEENLLTLYVYDNARYQNFANAKEAALADAANVEKVQALQDAITDCKENVPVYTKVKFEYRVPTGKNTDNDVISLYMDTTEENADNLIAATADLAEQNSAAETDWITFSDAEGNPKRISGNHQLTVWLSSAQIRLISFTLANDDETMQKQIDAISLTNLGKPNNFCINQLNNASLGGSLPHEARGAASWLLYTWPDHDDFTSLVFEGNSKAWPLKGKTGPGFDFEIKLGLIEVLQAATDELENSDVYTTESFAAFKTAYEEAQYAVEKFAQVNLIASSAQQLQDALETAVEGLTYKQALFTVKADEDNAQVLEFDATGCSNVNGANQSMNPTVTVEKNSNASFLIQFNEEAENTLVTVKAFGYRGSRGTTQQELTLIEPLLATSDIQITDMGNDTYKVAWNAKLPGNYRVLLQVQAGEVVEEQVVELVCRNDVKRDDFTPKYVRMHFAGFRNDEEKKVNLHLVQEGQTASADNLIAVLSSTWEMDAQYALTDWVEIQWPADYDSALNYQLVAEVPQRNTAINFFEFATESYKTLYADSYQSYPLAEAGVMRIEAEHYDHNTMSGFEAVDFNGTYGWENGTPGDRTGAIGTTSNLKALTVTYNNVGFGAVGENAATESISVVTEKTAMFKDETQTAQVNVVPEENAQQISYNSSDASVVAVDANGILYAKAAGSAEITALNGEKISEPVVVYVADKEYLQSLMADYEQYITVSGGDAVAEGYTTESWNAMSEAYANAQNAMQSEDAKVVYDASVALKAAIDGRVEASNLKALNMYLELAAKLTEEDYTSESWAVLEQAVAAANTCTKDTTQQEVNRIAGNLQMALYGLEVPKVEVVDVTELTALVNQAQTVQSQGQKDYTQESWNSFISTLNNAKALLESNDLTQIQVQTAQEELQLAMNSLEKIPVNKKELEELYNRYCNLAETGYTAESYNSFKTALNQAKTVLNNTNATQAQVNTALANLQTKITQLTVKPAVVNKSSLQALYNEYRTMQQGDYTDESWQAFQKALNDAKKLLENANATQAQVDAMVTLVKDAKKYLVVKEPSDSTVPGGSPQPAPNGWDIVDGKEYWYENGVLQGTEGRGKEIYDPESDAWYWLDSVLGGAVAKSKDVYQESAAGQWADRADGTGKWVRYDENGHMIKGWQNTDAGKYYFDTTFGTMAKGYATIEGVEYYFDEATGVLVSEMGEVPESGWKVIDGMSYWYEASVRQGFKVDDSYRGKEIYDAETDGWYWLDNVQGGAKAVSKDVYQESYSAYPDREDGTGKWVRYDENGRMIKGWQYTDAGTYYFEEVTGSMAKGHVTIDGQEYYFDEATGILQ